MAEFILVIFLLVGILNLITSVYGLCGCATSGRLSDRISAMDTRMFMAELRLDELENANNGDDDEEDDEDDEGDEDELRCAYEDGPDAYREEDAASACSGPCCGGYVEDDPRCNTSSCGTSSNEGVTPTTNHFGSSPAESYDFCDENIGD